MICERPARRALLICIFLFSVSTVFAGAEDGDSAFSGQVDSLFAPSNRPDVPGAAAAITHGGQVIYKKCYGVANLEHKVPITPRTVFDLASASKQFTAMAILLLEQSGQLSLDDDIRRYLPELPEYEKPVTIRHLLHHTSGIWEYWILLTYYGGYRHRDYFEFSDVYEFLKHQKELLFEPGSQWKYCNTGYVLLAEIAARVTGESFFSWTKQHIFDAIGMENSFSQDNCRRVIPNAARCYYQSHEGYLTDRQSNVDFAGQAHVMTTVDDMILWLDNFRTKSVGGQEVVERMLSGSKLNDGSNNFYGYGLGVHTRHGKKVVDHSGQSGSFMTMVAYCPDDETGVVVLANNREIKSENIGYRILDLYWGIETAVTEEPFEQKPFLLLDSVPCERYVGGFILDGNAGKLAVARLGEEYLYCMFEGLGADLFYPLSDTQVVTSGRDVGITFLDDGDRRFNRVMLDVKGDTMWANRKVMEAVTPEQLDAYSGEYYSPIFSTVYEVVVKSDTLVLRHRRYGDRAMQLTDTDEFLGGMGLIRFKRDIHGKVSAFEILDEDFGFKPISFRRIRGS